MTDSNNNVENISWDGYNAHPVYGSVQLANGGSGSSASATVPNSTATSMTETVTVPNGATVQVPLQVDAGTPPATETYPNGMTVTQDSTNGTATATQTDANGVTWTVQASINSDDTMATVNVTSTAGDSFTKLVPVNNDMLPGQYLQSKGRSAQSATRSTRAWSEAQQSGVARGVAMAAMGILVLGGAPLAAAAIGVAVGVAMVAQAARGKP